MLFDSLFRVFSSFAETEEEATEEINNTFPSPVVVGLVFATKPKVRINLFFCPETLLAFLTLEAKTTEPAMAALPHRIDGIKLNGNEATRESFKL
jgi:hypothetical protein